MWQDKIGYFVSCHSVNNITYLLYLNVLCGIYCREQVHALCEAGGLLVQCYLDAGVRVVNAPQGRGRSGRRPTPKVKG